MRKLLTILVLALGFSFACNAQQIIPIVSNTATINMGQATSTYFKIIVTDTVAVSITNQPTGSPTVITILFTQDGTGHSVTFSGNIANPPNVGTGSNASTSVSLQYDGNSNYWYGLSGGASSFAYIGILSGIPAACSVGQVSFITNATAGQNLYYCTSTNTWTQQLNSGVGGATTALDNLASVNVNSSILFQTTLDVGSAAKPLRNLYFYGGGTYGTTSVQLTGTPTGTRVWTFPDSTDTVVGLAATQTLTNKTVDGVTPTVFGYIDPTSSIQTQLNAKAPTASPSFSGTVAGTFTFNMAGVTVTNAPTWNQNTTGSAAKWTTARNLAGNSVDGSANVAFSNKFIVQGTADSGLSGAQFLGALSTGLLKVTTSTGVLSDGAAADVYGLWSGTCNSSSYLRGDGACATPSGSISGLSTGYIPKAGSSTSITANSALDDGITTAGIVTSTEPIAVASDGTHAGLNGLIGNTTLPILTGLTSNYIGWIGPNSASFTSYFLQFPATAPSGTQYLGCGTPSSNVTACTWNTIAGSGTVTSATVAGTANQITASGTCTITTTGTCTLSLPNGVQLGTDNSAAGSVQVANGSANAHTIWGSGATTSNTINGFATVPTTGDLVDCSTASTTCTLHDSGVLTANVVTAASNFTNANLVQAAGANKTTSDSGIATANVVTAASNGTTKQLCTVASSNKACSFVDFPEHAIVPAANCNSSTAGAGWSIPASNAPTVACRAGTNNLGGVLQWANNNTTTNSQFTFQLPNDWDTGTQPYINIYYGSGSNTSGTVKWTFSTACTKSDGSVTDDPAFNAESATTGKTMAVANREWAESLQFTTLTSGNNCIAGSMVIVKVTSGNGTATSTVNVEQAVITTPRLITVQAN